MKTIISLISLLSAATSVVAHGAIVQFGVPGARTRIGPLPGKGLGVINDSPIWSVARQDPIYGSNNPFITCGDNAKPGNEVADVSPGTNVTFVWKNSAGQNWPHDTGPIMTYMASCGSRNCNQIKNPASSLKWFKVSQLGRVPGSSSWYQKALMQGAPSHATIPSNLAPGNYMIRHEIIALHIADQGKAEFYPGCVSVRVTGTGTGVPLPSDLVTFPGAYKDTDPGIFSQDIYNVNIKYPFPGPKIAALTPGLGGIAVDKELTNNSPADPVKRAVFDIHSRRISRVMKRLLLD